MNIAIRTLPVLPRMEAESENPLATPTEVREERNAVATNGVDSHGDYLFNFAVGQVRDSHVAEVLVQETFLGALKSQASFSGRSSQRTWLVSILRHKICDHLRRTCPERAVRVEPLPTRNDDEAFDESLL